LTYDDCKRIQQKHTIKSAQEKALDGAGKFPNCRGLYPDCPETPSLKEKACRTCPKTEEIEPDEIDEE